jgi:tetratricopeptide (TPR) repeat protein
MKLKEVAVSNIRSKVEETYKSRDMIGNFNLQKFRSMVTEAQKGNNEILQKIEKSYLLYTGGVELMYHWAAYGLMGLTYSEAFEQFLDIIYLTINPQDFSQMQTMFGNNINLEYQCLPDYLEKKQNFEFYFKRGYEKTIRNMHREAIEDYNLAIAINPNNPDVYHYRGTSKDELKDYKGSILDYNKAIYILTKTIEYYSFNKNNQTKMNDYKENNYNQNNYMDDKSKLANILYDRGSAKDEIQDFIGAINDYSKTIEINPNNFKAYVNRGLAKYHMKDNLSAIGIRRQLIVNFKLKLLIFIELHQIISYK